jgi:hypothetical protein
LFDKRRLGASAKRWLAWESKKKFAIASTGAAHARESAHRKDRWSKVASAFASTTFVSILADQPEACPRNPQFKFGDGWGGGQTQTDDTLTRPPDSSQLSHKCVLSLAWRRRWCGAISLPER